jgi:MFS family permease
MIRDLQTTRLAAYCGITSFILTFGSAPLVLAPMSEVYGRHILYIVSAAIFGLFILAQALAPNIGTIIVSRFFAGIGGSTGVAIVGGTLSDVWDDADRSLPMNFFSWSAFLTTGLGPVIFGWVEFRVGWRYVQWVRVLEISLDAQIGRRRYRRNSAWPASCSFSSSSSVRRPGRQCCYRGRRSGYGKRRATRGGSPPPTANARASVSCYASLCLGR